MVSEELLEHISTILKIDKNSISTNSSITNTPGWDSYTHLKLIIELSIIYNFNVTATLISNLISFEALYTYLEQINKNTKEK